MTTWEHFFEVHIQMRIKHYCSETSRKRPPLMSGLCRRLWERGGRLREVSLNSNLTDRGTNRGRLRELVAQGGSTVSHGLS